MPRINYRESAICVRRLPSALNQRGRFTQPNTIPVIPNMFFKLVILGLVKLGIQPPARRKGG